MESVRKALWFIEGQFGGEVSLDELSMVAGIYRHHFAHVFAGATGQSAMRYMRGRRLSEAARVLANGGADILTVALDFGYGSHEAFTRAFRDQFGVTPNRFARNAISITSIWWKQSNLITPAGLGREINATLLRASSPRPARAN